MAAICGLENVIDSERRIYFSWRRQAQRASSVTDWEPPQHHSASPPPPLLLSFNSRPSSPPPGGTSLKISQLYSEPALGISDVGEPGTAVKLESERRSDRSQEPDSSLCCCTHGPDCLTSQRQEAVVSQPTTPRMHWADCCCATDSLYSVCVHTVSVRRHCSCTQCRIN